MVKYRQKDFSEFDAMRSLYVELMKVSDKTRFKIIDQSALIPILKGNNVVIEKFVISTTRFGKDKYRMYLKIGAKAKMPDEVRLPGFTFDKRLLNARLEIKGSNFAEDKTFSERLSLFSNKNKSGGVPPYISATLNPSIEISQQVTELLGDAIMYSKKSRSLVLEFKQIHDAIKALNILPFGLGYKIYLLDA